jgi:hypothetical protein
VDRHFSFYEMDQARRLGDGTPLKFLPAFAHLRNVLLAVFSCNGLKSLSTTVKWLAEDLSAHFTNEKGRARILTEKAQERVDSGALCHCEFSWTLNSWVSPSQTTATVAGLLGNQAPLLGC